MIIVIQNGKSKVISHNGKQYDGEKIPGDLKKWNYLGTDPNEILIFTYDILSQRSTTLYHTHPPVAAAINKQTQYAIGPGLVFRSQPDWETLEMTKEAAKDWGMRFQKIVHYVFKLTNFYEKQPILFRTALIMGDSLLFFDRSLKNGIPFDLIETGGDEINFQASNINSKDGITLGVIHDKAKRRQGVILYDGSEIKFKDENNDQILIMFYNKQMARQLRGFPLAYKIIAAAKNNDRWWDATLARAVMETIILGTSNEDSSESEFYNQAETLADLARTERNESDSDTAVRKVEGINPQISGAVYSYKGKGGIKFTDLKTPSNNFDKMHIAYIEMVGMGTDVPPEVILSKYSTSYTAHKGAFNDFIKSYMMYRWKFSNIVMDPIIFEIAKWAIMNKLIEMPNPDFFDNPIIQQAVIAGNYLGPVPGHINPAQEVQAKAEEVKQAFRLRSDIALEYGNEFDNFIEEWMQEEKEWKKMNPEKQVATIQNEIIENDENQENENEDNIS